MAVNEEMRIKTWMRKIVFSNKVTRLTYKGIKSLILNGPRETYRRVKSKKEFDKAMRQSVERFRGCTVEERKKQQSTIFTKKIVFSIVVPLYNTPEQFLREMIESVQNQTYKHWELCMADGSSEEYKNVEEICREYMGKDCRIKYKKLEENKGISENTNECLTMAEGDYIALFDHDDLLHESALYYYMVEIEQRNADFLYCDELVFENTLDTIRSFHFKPVYAIDNLRANNYICHFTVFHRALLDKVGGFRKEFDGSQDHDMILRLTEQAKVIVHVPHVLYFWRCHPNSVASDINSKTYAINAGRRAVESHLERVGYKTATVENSKDFGVIYKVNYDISKNPLVSIFIRNRDENPQLTRCVDAILEKTQYANYEIVIIQEGCTSNKENRSYEKYSNDDRVRVVYQEVFMSKPELYNGVVAEGVGEYLVFISNNLEVVNEEWLEELLMYALRSDVGVVGGKVLSERGNIRHAGIVLGMGSDRIGWRTHYDCEADNFGYMGRLLYAHNMTAVSGGCIMVGKEKFEQVGGFSMEYGRTLYDIDLCLRLYSEGFLNVWTPFSILCENSKRRSARDYCDYDKEDIVVFRDKWHQMIESGDKLYNSNLSLRYTDFRIKQYGEDSLRDSNY